MTKIIGTLSKFILTLLGYIVKKNENIWLFGEANGKLFVSNSKYLYLHILKNHKNIRPIWLTARKDILEEVKNLSGKGYLFNTIHALYYGLIAKVYIHSYGRNDILNYSLTNSIFVNLYHAMPIKKLNIYKRSDDLDIASSKFTLKTRKKIFPNIKKTIITGEPRYDIFFSNTDKRKILKKYSLEKFTNDKIITYLPTFRRFRDSFQPLFKDIPNIKDAVIFEKSHPMEEYHSNSTKGVVNISNLRIDTQELLSITNILITDYSSCYVDFLLTERPVIFYMYDLEEYILKRGLAYHPDEFVSSKICRNETEVLESIKLFLKNPNIGKEKRKEMKNKFHKYQDGNCSERVYQEIIKLSRHVR